MGTKHILVVDDEDNLRTMLCAALRFNGFEISAATTGTEALDQITTLRPDLILLDVMLPDIDGFEVCRRLRNDGDHTPVLFLTARDSVADKVRGLTLGGDDYIEKPFSLEELVARAEAVLRRTAEGTGGRSALLELDDLTLDDDAHLVHKAGAAVHLSPTEYKLLRYLLINQKRVVSRTQILDNVWDYDFEGDGRVVETYVAYLRRKLDTSEPRLIHTIRGIGYTMRLPE